MTSTSKIKLAFPMSPRSMSMLMGLVILSLVLIFLWFSQWLKTQTIPKLMVRQVSTVALPPPPPPPPPRQQQVSQPTTLSVEVQGQGAIMPIIDTTDVPLDEFKPPEMSISTMQTQWQSLEVDWQILDLDTLDSLPTLLTPLRVVFPASLKRQGITQTRVKLDVMIDETGRVSLIAVASNPYPELDAALRKLVRSSRFTPPQKDQQPARARFIWPINIKA